MRRPVLWTVVALSTVGYLVSLVMAADLLAAADMSAWVWVVVAVPSMIVAGAVMAARRPQNPIGPLTVWCGLALFLVPTLLELPTLLAHERAGSQSWMWLPMWLAMTSIAVGVVLLNQLMVVLPDGHVRYPRERRFLAVAWLTVVLPTVSLVANPTVSTHSQAFVGLDEVPSPIFVPAVEPLGLAVDEALALSYGLLIIAVILLFLRYRDASPRHRKQIRWVLFGGSTALLLGVLPYLLGEIGVVTPIDHGETLAWLSVVPMLPFVASVVVAVIEPKWVDVDFVIRKSFVYGALSGLILLLYVGTAAALGLAAGARLPIEVAVLLTVLVVVAFQPLRRRLQDVADRWVFGDRPTTSEAISEFGESIGSAEKPSDLLRRLVEAVEAALSTDWVVAELDDGSTASTGHVDAEPALVVSIGIGEESIGTLRCGPGPKGAFDAEEEHLVRAVAGQTALAIRNARLAARVVYAAESERRRIERNIHDGAQQELVALVAKLGLARSAVSLGDLTPAEVDELQRDARSILSDLRELAQGIHPSVLTDGGLVEAVEERCAHLPLDVTIHSSDSLRSARYADDVEGAAYFFVAESLANVLKHADATNATVRIVDAGDRLDLGVRDDGRGFDAGAATRNGLAGLDDRLRALGGDFAVVSRPGAGTELRASLPARRR